MRRAISSIPGKDNVIKSSSDIGLHSFLLTLGQSLLGGISIDIQSGALKQLDKSVERKY